MNFIRIISFLVLILTYGKTNGQDNREFCGVIEYEYSYFKKDRDITNRHKKIRNEKYFICGNNFKILIDNVLSAMYIGDSNKYFLFSNNIAYYYNADSVYGEPKSNYGPLTNGIYENKTYKTLTIKSSKDSTTHFVDNSVSIDPKRFESLKLFYWNEFFRQTNGSISLVSINQRGKFKMIREAVRIEPLDSSQIDFVVPKEYETYFSEGMKIY